MFYTDWEHTLQQIIILCQTKWKWARHNAELIRKQSNIKPYLNRLLFASGQSNTFDDSFLKNSKDCDRYKQCDYRRNNHHAVFTCIGRIERSDYLHYLHQIGIVRNSQRRPNKVIPRRHEYAYSGNYHRSSTHRQKNAKVNAYFRCSVNGCRFFDVARNVVVKLPEKEYYVWCQYLF